MKTPIATLLLAALATFPLAAQAKVTRVVERAFPVRPGGNFKALTQGGEIKVQTADVPEVRIKAIEAIRADSEAEADLLLKKLALDFAQSGNDITVEAKYEREGDRHFVSWPPVTVSFEVVLPKEFNATLKTSGGNIRVDDLKGNIALHTSGGDLEIARIEGDVEGVTSGGDIHLKEGSARTKLHTSGGNVVVQRAGGPTEVSTSGGDIRLEQVAELVSASTSGGNIRADLTGPIRKDAALSTSGGKVLLRVAKTASFQFDASTSGGEVDVAGVTLTIDKGGVGKSRLSGTVNGGGPRLKVRASGGDIRLRVE